MGVCFISTMLTSEIYKIYLEHPNICTDTRKIIDKGMFFALKGNNFNGNTFALESIKQGCSFAVVDDKDLINNSNLILVENVLETLQDLARHHRNQLDIPVIGITGTNGKTTSKELINTVLNSSISCYATKGNLNNHIGVALSILKIKLTHQLAVIEMGANHNKEIEFLCNIAKPTHGVITNIGKAHLKGFKNFEGIIKTNRFIYKFIKKNNGILFVNSDDELLTKLSKGIKKELYGTKSDFNLTIENTDPFVNINWDNNLITSNLIGDYQFYNLALTICIGEHFKISKRNIKKQIEAYRPRNNRSEIIQTTSNLIIMDAYNANPSSMSAMIKSFAKNNYKSKLVILGDMLELGKYATSEHNIILKLCQKLKLDHILVGEEFRKINNKSYKNKNDLIKFLMKKPLYNKTILLKGSRSIGLEELVSSL